MPFHQGLHCLPKYRLGDSGLQVVKSVIDIVVFWFTRPSDTCKPKYKGQFQGEIQFSGFFCDSVSVKDSKLV